MTTTVQLLGTTGEHAADTQIVAYGTIQCYQGDHIVVICAADNAGAAGATAISSISSSKSMSWGLRQRMNKTGGTVADGADIGIWEAEVGPNGFAVNDWVAINFSAATTCKSLILYRLAAATNKFHYWPTLGNYDTMNSTGYGGSSQWQMGTVAAGDCYIFAMSSEGNYVPSGYAAAGYNENSGAPATNCQGIWTGVVQVRCDTTTGTTHLSGVAQAVPVTAAGALGWQMTFGESSDRVAAYIVIREADAGPSTAPGTPTVSVNGAGSYSVNWTAPSNDGHRAVQYYHVYYDAGGGWLYHQQVAGFSATCGGFGAGANVRFKIYAYNGVNWSLESGVSGYVQMWSAPSAPGTPVVTPNSIGGFGLTWAAPGSNGGTALTSYAIQYSYNNVNWTDPGWYPVNASYTVAPGTFANNTLVYFKIFASNAMGWGVAGGSGSATTWRVPDPPLTTVVAPQGGGVYSLTWSTPANGGTAITDYIIEDSQNDGTWTVYPDSVGVSIGLVMSGLNNVDKWEFRVKAVNAVGQGGYGPIALSDNTLLVAPVVAKTGVTFAPTRTAASTADPALHGPRIGTIWAISGSITVMVVPAVEPQTGVTFAPAGIFRSATVTLPTEVQTGTTYVPLIYRSATALPAVEVQTGATFAPTRTPASTVDPIVEAQAGTTYVPTRTPASTVDPSLVAFGSTRYVPASFLASGNIATTTVAKTGTTFAATIKITATTTPVTLLVKTGATFSPTETAASTADPPVEAQTGVTFAPTRSAASFVQVPVEVQTGASYAPVISATGLVSVADVADGTSTRFAVTLKINSTVFPSVLVRTGVAAVPTFGAGASVAPTVALSTRTIFSPLISVSASRAPTPVAGTSSTYAPTIKVNASVIAGGLARLSVVSLPTFGIGITLLPGSPAGTSARFVPTYATTGTALPSASAGVGSTLVPFARFGVSLTAPTMAKTSAALLPFFGVGSGLSPGVAVGTGSTLATAFSITGTAVTPSMARTSVTYSVAFSIGPTAVTTTAVATSLTYVPLRTAASFVTAPVSARTATLYASAVEVFSGTFVYPALVVATSATYVAGSSTDRTAIPTSADGLSVLYVPTFKVTGVIVLASPVPRTGNTNPVSYSKTGTATPSTLVRTSLTYATVGEGGATFTANFTTGSSSVYTPAGSIGRIAFPNRKAASSTLYDPFQLIALVIALAVNVDRTGQTYAPSAFYTTALVEVANFAEGSSVLYDPVFKTTISVTTKRIAALGDTNWNAYDFDFAWA